jgi:hypothetical protein
MEKLLAIYLAHPTSHNALKILYYLRKHPMCVLRLDHLGRGLLREAISW